MNRQHKQHTLVSAALAACLSLTAGTAQAAGAPDPNTLTPASANLNFSTQTGFRHVLIPAQGYFGGVVTSGQLLANGTADSGDGASSLYGVRFTPGGNFIADASQPPGSDLYNGRLTGTTDSAHVLKIQLYTYPGLCGGTTATYVREADGWMHCTNAGATPAAAYKIMANGAQSVAADIYTVSMDAASWIN